MSVGVRAEGGDRCQIRCISCHIWFWDRQEAIEHFEDKHNKEGKAS